MRPFTYEQALDRSDAVRLLAAHAPDADHAPAQFFAGGTTLLDLMKLGSWHPQALIDIGALRRDHAAVRVGADGLHLGALARMSEVADHPLVLRDAPVLAQSLQLAASPQLRNMASLAGTLLQRTRCNYFRDPSFSRCNKRAPGTGCSALEGNSRHLAVLGVGEACIAHYPGDFANGLVALDAVAHLSGHEGDRDLPVEELHRLPGDTPDVETNLRPGELITGFTVPLQPWFRRSLYLKVRDRQSYAFALTSAAVALDLDGDTMRDVRVALGGVAAKPWRAHEVEAALRGKTLNEATAKTAAEAAFAAAVTRPDNAYKVDLGRRTLVRALLAAATLEV